MSGDSCLPQHHTQSDCTSPPPPLACPKTKTCSYQGAVGLGNKYVRLNVGGNLFYTTLQVLTRQNSMLKAMFSGKKEVFTDKEGWILIDRSGKHFGSILCYLRDGTVTLPKGRQAIQELMAEAKYYLIQGLVELCQNTLQGNKEQPLCVIPVVTSSKEEERLIQSSVKPVVKLVYNRSNNKYSYTSNSDDNLLKNIELFDRLSLSFNGRVLFIKDVIGDEICCWSFYGQGRKLAEVCCTSIVYATEKKQTKLMKSAGGGEVSVRWLKKAQSEWQPPWPLQLSPVQHGLVKIYIPVHYQDQDIQDMYCRKVEFPEARIYEETLNTLLYETMPLPDNTLLEATRRSYTNCGSHSEEEEGPGGTELRERVRRIHVKRYSTYDDRPLGH